MTGPLAQFGAAWAEFVDRLTDFEVETLRRMAARMDEDAQARSDVEGCHDWRDLTRLAAVRAMQEALQEETL